jgi:hypothetical protein
MRKHKTNEREGVAQLEGSGVYPVGELDAGNSKGGEHRGLYEADGQYDHRRYQDAPVEMGTYDRSPETE